MIRAKPILHVCRCGHLLAYNTDNDGAVTTRSLNRSPIGTCCLCNTLTGTNDKPIITKNMHPWAGCVLEVHER